MKANISNTSFGCCPIVLPSVATRETFVKFTKIHKLIQQHKIYIFSLPRAVLQKILKHEICVGYEKVNRSTRCLSGREVFTQYLMDLKVT